MKNIALLAFFFFFFETTSHTGRRVLPVVGILYYINNYISLGQYDSLGKYCSPHTASLVFLISVPVNELCNALVCNIINRANITHAKL